MANLTKGTDLALPLFLNIDQRVGEGCPNLPEDVALVSYLMRVSAKGAGPKTKAIFLNTPVGTTCTPALIQSIRALQAAQGGPQDGRISPSTPNGRYSKDQYMLFVISKWVRKDYPDLWPRIDRIPDVPTPAAVAALVRRVILGSG